MIRRKYGGCLYASFLNASRVMRNNKPLVAVACLCEKVLREEDGVLSAIRVVDTYFIPQTAPAGAAVSLTALICLKSGDVEGKSEISFRLTAPDGKEVGAPPTYPILLEGREHGANLIVQLGLPAANLGHYMLDVLWNGEPLVGIPFKLVQQTPPTPAAK